MRIEVNHEVSREVRRLCEMLNVTPDALFRRLLKLPEDPETPLPQSQTPKAQEVNGLTTRDGIVLRDGLQLRARYKGKEYVATVQQGGITVKGMARKFRSPSLAAVAVTGYPVNGWNFWEYQVDDEKDVWRRLNEMRSGT